MSLSHQCEIIKNLRFLVAQNARKRSFTSLIDAEKCCMGEISACYSLDIPGVENVIGSSILKEKDRGVTKITVGNFSVCHNRRVCPNTRETNA